MIIILTLILLPSVRSVSGRESQHPEGAPWLHLFSRLGSSRVLSVRAPDLKAPLERELPLRAAVALGKNASIPQGHFMFPLSS